MTKKRRVRANHLKKQVFVIFFILIITVDGFLILEGEQPNQEDMIARLADGTTWGLHWKGPMKIWMPDFGERFKVENTPATPCIGQDQSKCDFNYMLTK